MCCMCAIMIKMGGTPSSKNQPYFAIRFCWPIRGRMFCFVCVCGCLAVEQCRLSRDNVSLGVKCIYPNPHQSVSRYRYSCKCGCFSAHVGCAYQTTTMGKFSIKTNPYALHSIRHAHTHTQNTESRTCIQYTRKQQQQHR